MDLMARGSTRPMRWNAGCAHGEEDGKGGVWCEDEAGWLGAKSWGFVLCGGTSAAIISSSFVRHISDIVMLPRGEVSGPAQQSRFVSRPVMYSVVSWLLSRSLGRLYPQ